MKYKKILKYTDEIAKELPYLAKAFTYAKKHRLSVPKRNLRITTGRYPNEVKEEAWRILREVEKELKKQDPTLVARTSRRIKNKDAYTYIIKDPKTGNFQTVPIKSMRDAYAPNLVPAYFLHYIPEPILNTLPEPVIKKLFTVNPVPKIAEKYVRNWLKRNMSTDLNAISTSRLKLNNKNITSPVIMFHETGHAENAVRYLPTRAFRISGIAKHKRMLKKIDKLAKKEIITKEDLPLYQDLASEIKRYPMYAEEMGANINALNNIIKGKPEFAYLKFTPLDLNKYKNKTLRELVADTLIPINEKAIEGKPGESLAKFKNIMTEISAANHQINLDQPLEELIDTYQAHMKKLPREQQLLTDLIARDLRIQGYEGYGQQIFRDLPPFFLLGPFSKDKRIAWTHDSSLMPYNPTYLKYKNFLTSLF